MSFFGLSLAGSALAAYQEAENVTSNNIANVNTPGASREQAILTPQAPVTGTIGAPMLTTPGTLGDGVLMSLIQRVHDDSYDSLYRNATSSQYYYSVQQSQLSAAQSLLAEPAGGINDAYTAFLQSFQTLQANPDDTSTASGVISSAQSLVSAISTTGNGLTTQMSQVFNQTSSLVTQVNNLLTNIAQLNGQIRAETAAGEQPGTYQDERDNDIDQLSQYLSVQTNLQPNGSALVTVNGLALVNDTTAYTLAQPVIGTAANGTTQMKIGFTTDANPLNPSAIPLGQGQLAGLVDLYNNKLSVYQQQLNSFTNALATEVDRVTTSGYDENGAPGVGLLQPLVNSQAISSTNIQVGITDPTQVVAAVASTANGSLTNPVNSSNQTVDTSTLLLNNPTLQVAPTAALNGSLTVVVDGVTQNFTYNSTPGVGQINASSIDSFIQSFNQLQAGVTASYDDTSQTVVFTRDSNNESSLLRATPGYVAGPTFSISDSNDPGDTTGSAAVNPMASSLLGVLGAAGIDGIANSQLTADAAAGSNTITLANVTGFAIGQTIAIDAGNGNYETDTITGITGTTLTLGAALGNDHVSNAEVYVVNAAPTVVQQNATNAYAADDNGASINMSAMFSDNVGVPGIDTQVGVFQPGPSVVAGVYTAAVGQTNITISEGAVPLPEFSEINVGNQLTFVNQAGQTVNGVVTAVNRNTGTISLQMTNNGAAAVTFSTNAVTPGDFTGVIASQTQTLGQSYASLIAQVGLDGQTATTGTTTQTNIATSINQTRQSIDGINLDEETQNLIMYQTSYQAAAKVVTMLDTMLQSVLGMIQ
ncbi:MAG: flagellar hook-associated protein FlgK [Vulcanimicrobiaceae bacterium]|jgi:flagellar hook-associated protein 1 FlgK